MHIELRSRETLVTWVAFCMLHASALVHWPALSAYRVPLHYTDLQDMVLHDKLARTALLRVAAYLRTYSSGSPSMVVFSLRSGQE